MVQYNDNTLWGAVPTSQTKQPKYNSEDPPGKNWEPAMIMYDREIPAKKAS